MHHFLHGDHHVASRQALTTLVDQAKAKGQEIIHLDGAKLVLGDLIQASKSDSLFGQDKIIIIENLFSRQKSKQQTEILDWLTSYTSVNPLLFWEKKSIGKVLQRRLPPKTSIKEFKTPVVVFKLVEQLSPQSKLQALKLFQEACQTESVEFLFAMITRQCRLMLLVADNQKIAGAPWMIGKLKKQAGLFSQKKLILLYQKLADIDINIKTGKTIMPLQWYLELWISYL